MRPRHDQLPTPDQAPERFQDMGYIPYAQLPWSEIVLSTGQGPVPEAPTNAPHRRERQASHNFEHGGKAYQAGVKAIETVSGNGATSSVEVDTLISRDDQAKSLSAGMIVHVSTNDERHPHIEVIPRIPDGTPSELAQMALQNGFNSIAEAARLAKRAIVHRVQLDRAVYPGVSPAVLEEMLEALAYRKTTEGNTTVYQGKYTPR